MPLQAKGDLRLALAAEQNNFIQYLIGILIRIFALYKRLHQSKALLQYRRRFNLIHQAVFALQGITHGASHMGFIVPHFWTLSSLVFLKM
jgi:hypothetical protein